MQIADDWSRRYNGWIDILIFVKFKTKITEFEIFLDFDFKLDC